MTDKNGVMWLNGGLGQVWIRVFGKDRYPIYGEMLK